MQHIINSLIKIAQQDQMEKTAAPAFLANLFGAGRRARAIQAQTEAISSGGKLFGGLGGMAFGGLKGLGLYEGKLISEAERLSENPDNTATSVGSLAGAIGSVGLGALVGGLAGQGLGNLVSRLARSGVGDKVISDNEILTRALAGGLGVGVPLGALTLNQAGLNNMAITDYAINQLKRDRQRRTEALETKWKNFEERIRGLTPTM